MSTVLPVRWLPASSAGSGPEISFSYSSVPFPKDMRPCAGPQVSEKVGMGSAPGAWRRRCSRTTNIALRASQFDFGRRDCQHFLWLFSHHVQGCGHGTKKGSGYFLLCCLQALLDPSALWCFAACFALVSLAAVLLDAPRSGARSSAHGAAMGTRAKNDRGLAVGQNPSALPGRTAMLARYVGSFACRHRLRCRVCWAHVGHLLPFR